jgi:enoyl-CoA hydratase/carnithine racemase
MADFEHVLYEQDGPVVVVTLNNPETLNALSRPLEAELHQALDRANEDAGVRAIILTGAGRAFSSGYDISGNRGEGEEGQQRVPLGAFLRKQWQRSRRNPDLMMHIMELPKPVIAAVNGWYIGGGL